MYIYDDPVFEHFSSSFLGYYMTLTRIYLLRFSLFCYDVHDQEVVLTRSESLFTQLGKKLWIFLFWRRLEGKVKVLSCGGIHVHCILLGEWVVKRRAIYDSKVTETTSERSGFKAQLRPNRTVSTFITPNAE